MLPLEPLPDTDLARLVELLYGLVMASLAAPEPPAKTCLRIARRYDPGTAAPLAVRLDQYMSDLDVYRDDVRLAVWPGLGVSGQAWDASTLLWRTGTATLDQVSARLALPRVHTRRVCGCAAGVKRARLAAGAGRAVRPRPRRAKRSWSRARKRRTAASTRRGPC